MRQVVFLYSNCQGESLIGFLRTHPDLVPMEFVFLRAWLQEAPGADQLARCALLVYQYRAQWINSAFIKKPHPCVLAIKSACRARCACTSSYHFCSALPPQVRPHRQTEHLAMNSLSYGEGPLHVAQLGIGGLEVRGYGVVNHAANTGIGQLLL